MIPEEKDIEQLLKNRIKDLEIAPPPGVWASIEHKLEEEKHRSGILLMFKMAASFALVAVVGISSLWLYRHSETHTKIAQNIFLHHVNHIQKNHQFRPEITGHGGNKNRVKIATPLMAQQTNLYQTVHKLNFPSQHSTKLTNTTATASMQMAENTATTETSEYNRNLSVSVADNMPAFQLTTPQSPGTENNKNDSNLVSAYPLELRALANINCPVQNPDFYKSAVMPGQPSRKKEPTEAHLDLKDPFNLNSVAASSAVTTSEKKWSIGGCYAPNYSFRTVSGEGSGDYSEKGLMAFSGGMKVKYATQSRWSVQSGIYYAQKGQIINNISVVNYLSTQSNMLQSVNTQSAAYILNNSTGEITSPSSNNSIKIVGTKCSGLADVSSGVYTQSAMASSSASSVNLVQSFDFIELPFVLNYKLIDRKTDVHVIGGISTNILVNNKIYDESDVHKRKLGSTDEVRIFNYSTVMGIGLEYPLSKKMTLSLDPTFNYNLNSFNKNDDINSHPYSYYFMAGINYIF